MRATRKLALASVLTTLVAGGLTAQNDRVRSVRTQASTPTPGLYDLSWYPHEQRPPFVSTLVEADQDTPDMIHAGNAIFTTEEEPDTPERMQKPEFRGRDFVPGYFIVHFDDALRKTDKDYLDELTGEVKRADGSKVVRW